MKDIESIIKKITEKWFLTEPVLFTTYCTHSLVSNDELTVPFRVGKRRIEYAPHILKDLDEPFIEELLRVEAVRILLKHPYQRKPAAARPELLAMASNITINDAEPFSDKAREFLHGTDIKFEDTLCFEEYYEQLKQEFPQLAAMTIFGSSNDGESVSILHIRQKGGAGSLEGDENSETGEGHGCESDSDENENENVGGHSAKESLTKESLLQKSMQQSYSTAELWEEDDEICCDINKIIDDAENTQQWGTLPGSLESQIKASRRIEMDYRRMLSHFRTSVLSSKRYLTRMKPSRRYGFDAMGSRYALASNLLIAVDVSGSVSDESLSNFFSVINRFFKYGIEKLDVIQSDHELKGEPLPMKKARSQVKIIGRGGTSFQPAADYYCAHPNYDGLIYFTDGYAPMPTFNTMRPFDVLWVLCGRQEYEVCRDEINAIKRNRATYIPKTVSNVQ